VLFGSFMSTTFALQRLSGLQAATFAERSLYKYWSRAAATHCQ